MKTVFSWKLGWTGICPNPDARLSVEKYFDSPSWSSLVTSLKIARRSRLRAKGDSLGRRNLLTPRQYSCNMSHLANQPLIMCPILSPFFYSSDESDGICTIWVHNEGTRLQYVEVQIQGVLAMGMIDSGADVTIMGADVFHCCCLGPVVCV